MQIKIKATLPSFTPPTPLQVWGFTLIEVIIVTAVIALLAAIAIPGLLRARMAANEALAKATLRSISSAVEMYMATNSGYPSSEADLIAPNASPPYLFRAYDNQTIKGYSYSYDFTSGYAVNAAPQTCGRSGSQVFSLSSGVINETACE
jgi:prepilin-type N-terminal cleavage/methylation domain-containing protein